MRSAGVLIVQFISRNCDFINRNSDFITGNCDFISCNSGEKSQICDFISHNSVKKLQISFFFIQWQNRHEYEIWNTHYANVLHLYLPAQFSEADVQFMLSAGGLLITAVVICYSQRRERRSINSLLGHNITNLFSSYTFIVNLS